MHRAYQSKQVIAALALAVFSVGWTNAHAAKGAGTLDLKMETHAAFFSAETKQSKPLDPQVFVRAANAPAGIGPQNIQHGAGLRPALITDPPQTTLFTAEGKPLGFTLGDWLGAKGTVDIAADRKTVTVRLEKLRPKATYSLFENHFDQQPIGFTPLDGTGSANSFVTSANGKAKVSVTAPDALTHANAVLLVFHSDNAAHGMSRGELGVTAHHQLIARIP